ncbi:MAG: hypothetical protein KUG82_18320 [Pseudomonadales bacterium]|nr:hypothetical protein [Pseudomonadales bacterium]
MKEINYIDSTKDMRAIAVGVVACLFLWMSSTVVSAENAMANVPIKIGGFFSTYANITDKKSPYLRFAKATDQIDFGKETFLGLQIKAELAERSNIYLQMVGDHYQDDFSVNLDWAYLKYNINDEVDFRMGKMGLPAFLYSDYTNVRYALTWARVPSEAYEMLPLGSFNGIDLLIRVPVGDYTLNIQPYFGNTSITSPFGFAGEVTTTIDDLIGIALSFDLDMQTFRLSYFEAVANMTDPALLLNLNLIHGGTIPNVPISDIVNDLEMSFTSFGYLLNYGSFELIVEASERDTPVPVISAFQAVFISAAYQVNDTYKPYIVLAKLDTRNVTSRPQEQFSISLGVRMELSGTMALKAEWQTADIDTDYTNNQGLFALGGLVEGESLDSVNLISVGLDAVF